MPNIEINFIAVLVAVVATFFFGFIWYTPLFGKIWAKEMGMDPTIKPNMGAMMKGMIAMVVGNFFLAYVLGHNMAAYDPVSWGLEPSVAAPISIAYMAAFFTWLGFYFPVDLGSIFWEQKSVKLFAINTGYHFFMLFVAATILAYM